MSVLRLLLLPFAYLYDGVTRLRNYMYDINWKPSVRFEIPVISVGNLAIGGTGKTPMVEHLVRLLMPLHQVATLSRGYGRRSKGFLVADQSADAVTLGDESYQVYKKYGTRIKVSVCEDRAFAIPHLLDQHPEVEVILLDDAFQHRRVVPGFSILMTEYHQPFYNDYVLPFGRLRESARGAARADVIVVTKCPPHLDEEMIMDMTSHIHRYTDKPVFFASIRYTDPQPATPAAGQLERQVVLVSGIANHHPLEEHIKKNYTLVKHFAFRDHHRYIKTELLMIEHFVQQHGPVSVLTTEKDWARLGRHDLQEITDRLPLFYQPMEMEFFQSGQDFDSLVLEFLKRQQHHT
jgi:tetraacyldisaccharide 4'-kinase